jgi:hypothetical protein
MNENHSSYDPRRQLETIRFGEYLYEKNLLDDAQLLEVLADHWSNGGRIGSVIARRGILTADEVERQAAMYHGLEVIEIDA